MSENLLRGNLSETATRIRLETSQRWAGQASHPEVDPVNLKVTLRGKDDESSSEFSSLTSQLHVYAKCVIHKRAT